jgi:hypothetical protein
VIVSQRDSNGTEVFGRLGALRCLGSGPHSSWCLSKTSAMGTSPMYTPRLGARLYGRRGLSERLISYPPVQVRIGGTTDSVHECPTNLTPSEGRS